MFRHLEPDERLNKRITLKAFANSSPGLRFGNPGKTDRVSLKRNSAGVAPAFVTTKLSQPFQVCEHLFSHF
jgi:hypothetical protein